MFNEYHFDNIFSSITYSQRPKSERSDSSQRWNPNKFVFELVLLQSIDQNPNVRTTMFGFRTPEFAQKRLKSEQICSDFRRYTLFKVNWNRTMDTCLKSERVQISDVYCTPNVRQSQFVVQFRNAQKESRIQSTARFQTIVTQFSPAETFASLALKVAG